MKSISSVCTSRCLLAVLALALSSAIPSAAIGADAADTILLRRGDIAITRADWDAEMQRIPPKDRADFTANPRRVQQLVERMLTTRELATLARQKKLDADPLIRIRVRQEEERLLAAAMIAKTEETAALDFEQKRPAWERRARELYDVDKARFATPETITVTLLFFSSGKEGFEGAQKRAEDALAKIKAGADIGDLAASVSDDPTTRDVRGRKGPLGRADMDSNLASAAFALKNKGDMTGAIRTREGWFIVRLDERSASKSRPFDEVKGEIMAELKQKHVDGARSALLASLGEEKDLALNPTAIEALRIPATKTP
jgi:peptidyl-prolyl cis-trans isomerase C